MTLSTVTLFRLTQSPLKDRQQAAGQGRSPVSCLLGGQPRPAVTAGAARGQCPKPRELAGTLAFLSDPGPEPITCNL